VGDGLTFARPRGGGSGGATRPQRNIAVVLLRFEDLPERRYTIRHHHVDPTHSNIREVWEGMGGGDWPDGSGWEALRRANRLEELEPARDEWADGGRLELDFELPMPSVSLVELTPA
jgi:xylan 1,4-beta-xylosidase